MSVDEQFREFEAFIESRFVSDYGDASIITSMELLGKAIKESLKEIEWKL